MRSARPSYSEMVEVFLSVKSQSRRNSNWLLITVLKWIPYFGKEIGKKKKKKDFVIVKKVTPPEGTSSDTISLTRCGPQRHFPGEGHEQETKPVRAGLLLSDPKAWEKCARGKGSEWAHLWDPLDCVSRI